MPELSLPDHDYNDLFEEVCDLVQGACAYCSKAFGVKDRVEESGVELLDDYAGHPSVRELINDGYGVVTF